MRSILIVSLIFLCTIAFAQDESKTSIAGGAKALIFEFDGLDNLSADSYNGGLGGKIYFSSSLALRVGFNFDYESETIHANPADDENGVDGEYSESTFGLLAAMEIHTRNKSRVSPYFGGGFGFTRYGSEYKEPDTYVPGGNSYRAVTEVSGSYSFGIFGLAGAELFILKEVSLSAEYNLFLAFGSDGDEKTTYVVTEGDPVFIPADVTDKGNSGWAIGTESRGMLILSIYF
ncbi:MAG: outer membrane beta-barrel protein [Calditrichaceae bacterium]|jgi:hypothetical protein